MSNLIFVDSVQAVMTKYYLRLIEIRCVFEIYSVFRELLLRRSAK